jgi:hypothetical protein
MDWKSASTKDGKVSIPDTWLFLHYYEALNILFRMENSLRVFVYVVLKNRFKEKWAETTPQTAEGEQSTITATAARRITQAKGFGYLGYEIASPLMYLNSGELIQIICSETYWSLFKPFFRGKKEIIKNKLDEIGSVRNALAHFRPLKHDDVELIKQNVKHAFLGIEQCLEEMTQTHRVVPTNTEEQWYKNLITLGSSRCTINLFQDRAEQWLRIEIDYQCAVLAPHYPGDYRSFHVTKLISPAVIKSFPKIARHCTFMSENVPFVTVTKDNTPEFRKEISVVFGKTAIIEHHAEISDEIGNVLLQIETETELVEKDALARGKLIDSTRVSASLHKGPENQWWSARTESLRCEFGQDDPSEYWGETDVFVSDFIAESTRYPWMPSDISKDISF